MIAFVATSVVTLVAAALALVPPLEHRLDENRLRDMRELARTARLVLTRLPARDLMPGAKRPRVIARQLARQMGGRVALFDANGLELADTDPERPDPRSGQPERLVDAGFARSGDVLDQITDGEAVVVAPMRTHAGRRTLVLRKELADSRAAVASVRDALPAAGIVGLLAAVGLGAALGFSLLRRLERLRRDARRLAEEGIEEPLALEHGHDQVAEVGRALESMRARLHAEERGRQAFLSTASHELRTPLASLRGTIEMLEEELNRGDPDLAGVRRRAAGAHRQTDRLTALAEDLLDLGRLDADMPLTVEPLELGELAGTIAAEARDAARAAGIALAVHAPEPMWAQGDARAAARIVRALLDNALRHGAAPGGSVTIAVHGGGGRVLITVTDDGAGVDEADRERIFGRFERGTARGAGFGLGLAIARGLARRMGGDVRLGPSDRGASFVAALPAAAAPVAAPIFVEPAVAGA